MPAPTLAVAHASADTEHRLADLIAAVAAFALDGADGRAGMMSVLNEIERLQPGVLECAAARIQLARLGLTSVVM